MRRQLTWIDHVINPTVGEGPDQESNHKYFDCTKINKIKGQNSGKKFRLNIP